MIRKYFNYLGFARQKAAEGHLSFSRQLLEMTILYLYRGLGPGYFLFGRFWRRELPLKGKLRHLNERAYVREVAKVNHPEYQKLSQHKVAEKAMLSLYNLPTPRFFGHLHPVVGRTYNGQSLNAVDDFVELLKLVRPAGVCLKPVEGWGGVGFRAAEVKYRDSELIQLRCLPSGEFQDPATYFSKNIDISDNTSGYIIEEYCSQHEWYKAVNPTSVNTIRVYAIQSSSGSVRILGGYLRAGRYGSAVDNASAGGIFCVFNPQSGVLDSARFDRFDSEDSSQHPDSGVQLEGVQLPCWEQVYELVVKTLDILPNTKFAGVDIAMTERGPCVIEINLQPDRTAACDIDVPTLDMLNPDGDDGFRIN